MSSYGSRNAAENRDKETSQEVSENIQNTRAPINQAVRTKKSPSAFKTISEVAETLDVQQHVLRFWETKFAQVKPLKRGGGRRYYRPEDIDLLKAIHHLLYTEKYTIKGVQKLLRDNGKNAVVDMVCGDAQDEFTASNAQVVAPNTSINSSQRALLEDALQDLKDLRKMIGEA